MQCPNLHAVFPGLTTNGSAWTALPQGPHPTSWSSPHLTLYLKPALTWVNHYWARNGPVRKALATAHNPLNLHPSLGPVYQSKITVSTKINKKTKQ